jgi:pimeloyl-ACP methyl ester carboxylesterase
VAVWPRARSFRSRAAPVTRLPVDRLGERFRHHVRPVLAERNLLAVDLRGTGASTPITCPGIQDFTGQTSGPSFDRVAWACGALLNHTWTDASGRHVAASDLFTSALAAADVAAVVGALGVPSVDLYGDSYGSWFAQVFANRYAQLLRSVILDSTYSTVTLDPWY